MDGLNVDFDDSKLRRKYEQVFIKDKKIKRDNIINVAFLIALFLIGSLSLFTLDIWSYNHDTFLNYIDIDISNIFIVIMFLTFFIGIPIIFIIDNQRKNKIMTPMSKDILNMYFDNVSLEPRGILTPEKFDEYDLLKYNWFKGSDLISFEYKGKPFISQDIIVYKFDETENKDIEIFKGQFISGEHQISLKDEVIIRDKMNKEYTDVGTKMKFNDQHLDNIYDIISLSGDSYDINNILENKYFINKLRDIINVSDEYINNPLAYSFAIKFYPDGNYVQIVSNFKDLFEVVNDMSYENCRDKIISDIKILIDELEIFNNFKNKGE